MNKWKLTVLYLERVLFDEASSITKPYTDFMSEDEVSELLNEHMETLPSHQSGVDSTQAVVHTQQTVQVVIHNTEPSKKRPSTPSFERNQRRGRVKKRATGAPEFAVHEDQPGTPSSVKVSLKFEPMCVALSISQTRPLDIHSRQADFRSLYRNRLLAVRDLPDRTSQKKILKRTKKVNWRQQRISVL